MSSKNSKMISELFYERSKFVLIGLTGRTGSGCTTAASVLEKLEPNYPKVEDTRVGTEPFYKGLDAKRYQILSEYARVNHKQFISVKVSDLISAYIISMKSTELVGFLHKVSGGASKSSINRVVSKGSFSKTYSKRGAVSNIIKKMLDHSSEVDLTASELSKFFSFMKLIKKFTVDFKGELMGIENKLYIRAYQAAGNSIRKLGFVSKDYDLMEFEPESVFHLPETINRVVKNVRKVRPNGAFVVIDAIRNPYEARFFKDRYSAFYLMSINAPDLDRRSYLQNVHKYTVDEFDDLEKRESGKTDISDADFVSQNVKKCIELSDIHIFNPRNELDNNNVLKSQLAWYVALMQHPGLVSPTSLERTMQMAYSAKLNSGCISRQVGAVVTSADYSIKAVGWNDVPKGQVPCNLRSLDGLLNGFNEVEYSEYERNNEQFREKAESQFECLKRSDGVCGKNLSYCFKDIKNSLDESGNQVHTRSLHAEENAFLQLAKHGSIGIEGGKLFTTASPCELCSKKAYQLGIKEIIFIDPYPGIATDHVISIGTDRPNLVQFMGAVGKGYHQLYEPTIAYKDELNYLMA